MIETLVAGKWRRATPDGDAFRVLLADSTVFFGVVIGGAAMARRFREGRARVVADTPRILSIRTGDPAVAEILGRMAVPADLDGAA